jgi:hypothetical protein
MVSAFHHGQSAEAVGAKVFSFRVTNVRQIGIANCFFFVFLENSFGLSKAAIRREDKQTNKPTTKMKLKKPQKNRPKKPNNV